MSSSDPENTLSDLVADCLSWRDLHGENVPYDELCVDHPELRDEVERDVARAVGLPRFQAAGPGRDAMLDSLLVGRYRISDRIGSGAMGVVYAAIDLDLGREVAIKVIHAGFGSQRTALARFDREASALAAVQHESIVTIYDRGVTEEGAPFLVMEKIDGASCSAILDAATRRAAGDDSRWIFEELGVEENGDSSYVRRAVRWAAELAGGLSAAHRVGVYHRDVKPSNVMIRRDGRAVLLDFGIAARDDDATLTRQGAAIGTPAYMPPEVAHGTTKTSPTQDVYGLAATLYHLLTLKAPYEGNPTEVLAALAVREPEPAFKVRPGLPMDAQAILDHGMSRNPAARYPSAAAVESDLRNLLAFRPISVRPTSAVVRALRLACRSRLLLGVASALVLVGALLATSSWNDARLERRGARFDDLWEHVPPNLGIVKKSNRKLADPAARAAIEANLNALVANGHGTVVAHTIRAAFRADQGDDRGAAEDIAKVAHGIGSPFSRSLAEAYREASEGPPVLELDSMPPPRSSDDHYLYAYHALRTGKLKGAFEALRESAGQLPQHGEELALLEGVIALSRLRREPSAEQFRSSRKLIDEVQSLEADFGRATAMTAHIRTFALLRQSRMQAALDACREVLALSPYSHVTLQNAAEAAFQQGHFDVAAGYAERALALTPKYATIRVLLARIEAERGNMDRARALLVDTATGTRDRHFELARVELTDAMRLSRSDPEEAANAARRVLAAVTPIRDQGPDEERAASMAEALLKGSDRELFEEYLVRLIAAPDSVQLLSYAARLLPEDLNSTESALLGDWMRERAHWLALQQELPNLPGSAAIETPNDTKGAAQALR